MAGTELANVRGAKHFDNENIPLSPRQSQRPDQPKPLDGRSNNLNVLTEDHFNTNDVANFLVRPRLKGATSISIPNDTSTTCRISWCGGIRGVLANLQKRAAECSMTVCPSLTKTRLWKDQPWNGETPNRRWRQVWCLCCKCSSQVSAYGREEKGAPMPTAPVSCGFCDGYGQNRKALREIMSGRCSLCKGVGRTGLCTTWSCLFSTGCDVCGKKGRSQETLPRNKCCFSEGHRGEWVQGVQRWNVRARRVHD